MKDLKLVALRKSDNVTVVGCALVEDESALEDFSELISEEINNALNECNFIGNQNKPEAVEVLSTVFDVTGADFKFYGYDEYTRKLVTAGKPHTSKFFPDCLTVDEVEIKNKFSDWCEMVEGNVVFVGGLYDNEVD